METYGKKGDNTLTETTPQEPKVEEFQLEQIERKILECEADVARATEELNIWKNRKLKAIELGIT